MLDISNTSTKHHEKFALVKMDAVLRISGSNIQMVPANDHDAHRMFGSRRKKVTSGAVP